MQTASKLNATYLPSSDPGVEIFKDIRAFANTYRETREVHLEAYKRLLLSNGPFQVCSNIRGSRNQIVYSSVRKHYP